MANALHHFAYAAILHSGMASMCRVEPQYCKIFEEHSLISENEMTNLNCTFNYLCSVLFVPRNYVFFHAW